MADRSLGVSIVPRASTAFVTAPMALAGLTVAACVVIRLSGLDHAGFSFCYFKATTGLACFTCGSTRAMGYLSRFDLSSAFEVQPLITAAALFLLFWGAIDAALMVVSRRTKLEMESRTLRRLTALGVALATLNWIYLLATGV